MEKMVLEMRLKNLNSALMFGVVSADKYIELYTEIFNRLRGL